MTNADVMTNQYKISEMNMRSNGHRRTYLQKIIFNWKAVNMCELSAITYPFTK